MTWSPREMVPKGKLRGKLLICVLRKKKVSVHCGPFRGWLAGLFSNKNPRDRKQCGRDLGFPGTGFLRSQLHGLWKDQALPHVLTDADHRWIASGECSSFTHLPLSSPPPRTDVPSGRGRAGIWVVSLLLLSNDPWCVTL